MILRTALERFGAVRVWWLDETTPPRTLRGGNPRR